MYLYYCFCLCLFFPLLYFWYIYIHPFGIEKLLQTVTVTALIHNKIKNQK